MGVNTCPQCGHSFSPEEVDSELAGMCPVCLAGVATADPQSLPSEGPPQPEIKPPQKETVYSPFKPGGKFRDLEILGQLGQGGMGVVYKARQVKLDRLVALKILAPQYAASPEFIQRFEREAKILASVNHPNVIQVYDFGKEGDILFLVLELVEGQDLESVFKKTKTVNVPRFLHVIREATKGLEAIHEVGLIHRDVKPANILLTKSGVTKLTDFGLAIDTDAKEKLTQSGLFVGTPHYVSPEHVQGKKIDARSDLYSVGVILFEGIAGRPPFDAASNTALLMKHVQEAPPPLYKYAPNTPKEIGEMVRKLLAKNPASRHDSAGTLLKDLDRGIEAAKTQGSTKRSVVGDFRILESQDAPPKTRRAAAATSATTPPWKLIAGCGAAAVILVVALVFLLGGSGEEAKVKPPPQRIAKARPQPPAAPNTPAPRAVTPQPTAKAVSPLPVPKSTTPFPDPAPPKINPQDKQDSTSKILEKALKEGDALLAEARKQYERGNAENSASLLAKAAFKAEAARVKYQAVIELGEGALKQKATLQTRAVQQLLKLANESRLALARPAPAPIPHTTPKQPDLPKPQEPPKPNSVEPPSPASEAQSLSPVPAAADLKAAEKKIREVLKADYAKKSQADRTALAQKLLKMGKEANDDPLSRFVLLKEGRDLSAAVGNAEMSLEAVGELSKSFRIDVLGMKMEVLGKAARVVRDPAAAGSVARAYLELVEQAIDADEYTHASTAVSKASSLGRSAKDAFLNTRIQELKKDVPLLKRDFLRVKSALGKDSPPKSEALGRYLCFVKNDWMAGLPMLASEAKEPLASLAKDELAMPAPPAKQVAVADGWLALAKKDKSPWRKAQIGNHAKSWYMRAKKQATGILALEIGKRLMELREVTGSSTDASALASLSEGLVGYWRFDEARGSSTADWSGKSNVASLRGKPTWTAGKLAGAIQLEGGKRQFVETSQSASELGIGGASPKTVAAWVYTHSFDNGGVFDLGNHASAENFALKTQTEDNQWRVNLWSSGEIDFRVSSLKSWVHLAVTYDGRTARVYANGSQVGSRGATLNTTDNIPFRVGRWRDDYFSGRIDEVRVYSRALTDSEINALAGSR